MSCQVCEDTVANSRDIYEQIPLLWKLLQVAVQELYETLWRSVLLSKENF